MRAEGPKERPTAVLSVQLSVRYVQIRQTAKILHPSGYYITTFLRAYIYTLRALPVPKRSRMNATAVAMSSYSVVRHVYLGASSRQPAQPRIKVL